MPRRAPGLGRARVQLVGPVEIAPDRSLTLGLELGGLTSPSPGEGANVSGSAQLASGVTFRVCYGVGTSHHTSDWQWTM